MNEIQTIETKVENGGTTPQGRVSAAEFNILADAAKRFDVSKYGSARITEEGKLQFFADAASMIAYEADPTTNAALLLKSLTLPIPAAVDISGKLDKAEFYKYFEEVNIGTAEAPVYATRSKRGLFSDSFLSAMGLNPGMGGGEGGGSYDRLDAWADYTDERAGWVLSAGLGYDLHNRVSSLEGGIVPDLSAYATREWVQLQGYATSAALTAHAGDTALHVSASERTLWNRTATDFAAIVGADSDQIINKWEEVVAFLDTYTEADTLANLLSNKVDKVEGYGLSKNDFTDALLSKLNDIEAGANRYVHPTGGADAAIDDAAGRVLAGITVNAQGHVTSVASKTLAEADIPALAISKVSGLQDALDGKLDKEEFYRFFEEVNIGTAEAPVYATRSKRGLFSDSFLSAMGLNSSGGGEGGGSYDRLDAWADYTDERAGWVLSAALGYDLHNRVRSLEGGSALSFTTEGSGNVVTAVKKSGTSVTVTKGLTALTAHQPIYALTFQAGAFEAKTYTPNTGVATVNIPTKTSHLSNDNGFITSSALTGYATQSWVQGLGYITSAALSNYVKTKEGQNVDANAITKTGIYGIASGGSANMPSIYGTLLNFYPYYGFQLFAHQYGAELYFRGYDASHASFTNWKKVVHSENYSSYINKSYIDGLNIAAASATKLLTACTIWGQSFDGTGNVSGNMTGVGSIAASGNITVTKIGAQVIVNNGTASLSLLNQTNRGVYDNTADTWLIGTNGADTFLLAGNIGLGTPNPEYRLDVLGNTRLAGEVLSTSVNSFRMVYGNYGAFWRNDGTRLYLMLTDAGNKYGSYNSYRPFQVGLSNGKVYIGSNSLVVEDGGNVGVKNSSPAYPLDVTGVIHSTTGIFSDGYMSAKGINTASDVRLKRRIADVALTVKDVAEAPVYRFEWINGGGIDVGSTAQYWAARVPELTHLLADGIHLGLDYGKAALLSVVSVARATADHERRIADIERQLQNRTI